MKLPFFQLQMETLLWREAHRNGGSSTPRDCGRYIMPSDAEAPPLVNEKISFVTGMSRGAKGSASLLPPRLCDKPPSKISWQTAVAGEHRRCRRSRDAEGFHAKTPSDVLLQSLVRLSFFFNYYQDNELFTAPGNGCVLPLPNDLERL